MGNADFTSMESSFRRFSSLLLIAVIAFVGISALRMWRHGRWPWEVFFPNSSHRPETFTLPEKAPLDLGDVELLSRLNNEYARLTQAVVPSVVSIDACLTSQKWLKSCGKLKSKNSSRSRA